MYVDIDQRGGLLAASSTFCSANWAKMTDIADLPDTPNIPGPVAWAVSEHLIDYTTALAAMEARVAAIATGDASEIIWLLEHPPLYTAGTSAAADELKDPGRFPVHVAGRGGRYTYHGPGQRIAYVMLDVRQRGGDVRVFVAELENWIIDVLDTFGVRGELREGRVGVWVRRPDKGAGVEDKIAALGLRIRRGISFHGLSINVEPELDHFSGIVPCGIIGHGVTSLVDLGRVVAMWDVDMAMRHHFERRFGATTQVPAPAR